MSWTKTFVLILGHHSHSASRYSPYPSPTSKTPYSPMGYRPIRSKPFCVDVGTNTSLPGCVNGRSPDLPANPVTWSVEQVVRYVRSTDCINYANIFLDQVKYTRFSAVMSLNPSVVCLLLKATAFSKGFILGMKKKHYSIPPCDLVI